MKIKVIMPIVSDIFNEEIKEEVKYYASENTEVAVCNLDYGPASIESEYDEALSIPDFLEKAKEAEEAGYQGVISDCLADPGVKAAREILDIPVVGPGETAMYYACSLGSSFSIVTVLPNVISMLENLSKTAGVDGKLASIRSVNIPVLEVHDKVRLKKALYDEMIKAIEQDHAHTIVLGCTGFMGVAFELQERLKENGYDVPVIDPMFAATKMLESLITMKVKQSRLTYMTPPSKQRVKSRD
ncbi:aspartate/glutamate racemase family protein [Virgibacillus halophilus]|uniref:Aspartate/glutamate racemase family protein n=1 Tax=Tigheibacillus halophilus TaxID=361280 RepID=A0ABU5C884_9BACI|nr:aspartate/glutamate racemase family protein [Virgibacillus halophilus]